jgi:hypothetical protein
MIIQDLDLVLSELGTLINNGYIQRISVEKRLVLLNECILSKLTSRGSKYIGRKAMRNEFQSILKRGIRDYPWSGRIYLNEDMNVNCVLEESMRPCDLDDMCDALEYFIEEIVEHLSLRKGKQKAELLITEIRNACNKAWAPFLSNVVI